ncbi:uncharacterized protein KGF55_005240 [Candida pseudojiufengensis]|uniref:uncharacterized protein n=1 Tax=Candida pseudojiufengensis TaxID=497109 RepID=UPI0022243D19|nr:uncharacterized protein KGF55_005240 [Candida pseudojiufengensis]KAI5959596.1 hypothetical protein KGF55_005240 [Candida pseudojiufengensis]
MSEVNNNEELALPPQYSRSRDNQVTNNFNINNESSYTQVEPPLYAESTPSDQESDLPQEYHKRRQIQQEENECSICCRDCSPEHQIKGQTAIVTGGTKNLGGETAKELARLGANLFLHYRSNEQQAKDFQKELSSKYPDIKIELYQADLTDDASLKKLFDEAKSKFSNGIDIAINNVGQVVKKPITEITEEEFNSLDSKNNKVAFFFIKYAGLNLNKNGRIISIGTSLLAAYTEYYGGYQGTKAPLEFYSKAASKELLPKGITSNIVSPGPMETSFLLNSETKESVDFFKTVGLHGRLTQVSDIVPIIRFLVTEGTWITGQNIFANGGFTSPK